MCQGFDKKQGRNVRIIPADLLVKLEFLHRFNS